MKDMIRTVASVSCICPFFLLPWSVLEVILEIIG